MKVGDVVRHVIGGPKMLVTEVSDEYGVRVRWWNDKKGHFNGATFDHFELIEHETPFDKMIKDKREARYEMRRRSPYKLEEMISNENHQIESKYA